MPSSPFGRIPTVSGNPVSDTKFSMKITLGITSHNQEIPPEHRGNVTSAYVGPPMMTINFERTVVADNAQDCATEVLKDLRQFMIDNGLIAPTIN